MKNPFLKAEEFESLYPNKRLSLLINKAKKSYGNYKIETIDYCKCIIEAICKEIYLIKEVSSSPSTHFHTLVKDTVVILGMERGQLSGGISSIAQSLGELRNNHGLSGHGHNSSVSLPTKIQIDIVVSTFSSLTNIILALLNEKEVDISKTTTDFFILQNKLNLSFGNIFIDRNVEVDYDKDEGIIYIDGKEIKPSEILYNYDRSNYVKKLRDHDEYLSNSIENLLEEELFNIFENEGLSLDYHEIDINNINLKDEILYVDGNIKARHESDTILDYVSKYSADIIPDYDEELYNLTLSNLSLEKSLIS